MTKPVLPLLLLTQGDDYVAARVQFAQRANLTSLELDTLKGLAIKEVEATTKLKSLSDKVVADSRLTIEEKHATISKARYNAEVVQVLRDTDAAVRGLLKNRYVDCRDAVREWWGVERQNAQKHKKSGDVGIQADVFSVEVFATHYAGYTNYEVALPDKYLKFANNGDPSPYTNPPYTVDLYRASSSLWVNGVSVLEVGPWNEDDNYWDSARRRFADLPLGKPEAEAAYYDGYNGGKDQFNRIVLNPAGIDLTDDVAADLGLAVGENAWIQVYYYDLP